MGIGPGATLGNYRVLSKLGTGGMGAVYLAEHPLIGKKVALKVIHKDLATNREVVQRFFQEAQAVNKIGNEHIVEIHDVGVTLEGEHYYIMEYLEGRTLASVLTTDRVMDVMRALHVGAQIASALSAAHTSGVIHRDLKPDNVMLLQRGAHHDFVKVLDFGLAKMFQGGSGVQTAAGVLLGTPQYMSPEACESRRDVDHRTDIYALGILLFQMMCGRLPFDGDSMGEVLVKQVTALPPAPRGINPAIPPSVEQILLRALAKPMDQRFPSMSTFREALLDPERYLGASPPMAPARSVAPGEAQVDARHVIAAAQAAAATRAAAAANAPSHAQATIIADRPAMPGGMSTNSIAKTMIDGVFSAPTQMHMPAPVQAPPVLPHMPAEPKMNTMRIATPHGYTKRPGRRVWPLVLIVGAALGLTGGVIAVIASGTEETQITSPRPRPTAGSGAGASSGSGSGVGSGSDHGLGSGLGSGPGSGATIASGSTPDSGAGSGSGSGSGSTTLGLGAGSGLAKLALSFQSTPDGATVHGPDGHALGKTPLTIEWPRGRDSVAFTLRKTGYRSAKQAIVVDGEKPVTVLVTLSKKAAEEPPGPRPSTQPDTGLERPF